MLQIVVGGASASDMWTWLRPALVAFVVAAFTVFGSNWLVNRREERKWRKDTAVRLCSDALAENLSLDNYLRIALRPDTADHEEHMEAAWLSARKVSLIASNLRIIGYTALADACADVRIASRVLEEPARQMRKSVTSYEQVKAIREEPTELPADASSLDTLHYELQRDLASYHAALNNYSQKVVDFMTAAQQELSPRGATMPEWPTEFNPRVQPVIPISSEPPKAQRQ